MKSYDNQPSNATPMQPEPSSRFLLRQSMLYSIAQIQALPQDRQETPLMHRLCYMVRHMMTETELEEFAFAVWGVECHVGEQINLWPPHGGFGPSGHYTDEELDAEETLRLTIRALEQRFALTDLLLDAPPSDATKFLH